MDKDTFYQILQIGRHTFFPHREGRIAIIGCGRSGTSYTSKLFNAFGYKIGHEALARHGISSWCIVPDTWRKCWGPSSKHLYWVRIPYVHQVRHPLKVIASLSTFDPHSWGFISRFIPIDENDSLTLKCMKYWFHWNLLAEKRAKLTYRVEDIENVLPELFKLGSFDQSRFDLDVVQGLRKNVNRREHDSVTWDKLRVEDAELTDRIMALASRLGYETH